MNGRKAKLFRRLARKYTVGAPEVKYKQTQDSSRFPVPKPGLTTHLIDCTRVMYKYFKKNPKETLKLYRINEKLKQARNSLLDNYYMSTSYKGDK